MSRTIWSQIFKCANEVATIDDWLNNHEENSDSEILAFCHTNLRYNPKQGISKTDKSKYSVDIYFTDFTQDLLWVERDPPSWHHHSKNKKVLEELIHKCRRDWVKISSQLNIAPSELATVWGTVLLSYGDISLSEHHQEQVADAIKAFPRNCIELGFEGRWTDTSHLLNADDSQVEINATAILNPSKIDVNVLSEPIP